MRLVRRNIINLLLLMVTGLLFINLLTSCAPAGSLAQIDRDAAPYKFQLLKWEVQTLVGQLFTKPARAAELSSPDEGKLERQIEEAIAGQGIHNPLDRFFNLKIFFPPVDFFLAAPPHLLVVSPRDHIEEINGVTLLPGMNEKEITALEDKVDKLGYSSLIVSLGGMATFPSYISSNSDLRYIIETAAHEWAHQYLAFTPLGFRYVLDEIGIKQSYDVITMNETVADIVGKEIGDMVYRQYYAPPESDNTTAPKTEKGFDFNAAMRETRKNVDAYLAGGQIDAAETYMEQQRKYMEDNGCWIRKLNQAYFAFYGTYADSPASVSPIGTEMASLRKNSGSLQAFLDKVTPMTTLRELDNAVK
jgi:hypothetical protein